MPTHPPSPSGRAIVSVPFARDQFEAVCDAAEVRGSKISAFVRDAALAAARPTTVVSVTFSANVTYAVIRVG